MQQLVLSQVSVEGGVLYTYKHGLLDGPRVAVNLLLHYMELVGVHGMSCGDTVVVYRGRGLEVFLDSVNLRSA